MKVVIDVIDKFTGPYRFLSNFFIEPDGTCVEIEYQRAKCSRLEDRARFERLTPGQARRLGRQVSIRPDWHDMKELLMYAFVEQKFRDHPALMEQLLATKPHELVEGNDWGDRFWGVCRGQGTNMLGRILMEVRDEE